VRARSNASHAVAATRPPSSGTGRSIGPGLCAALTACALLTACAGRPVRVAERGHAAAAAAARATAVDGRDLAASTRALLHGLAVAEPASGRIPADYTDRLVRTAQDAAARLPWIDLTAVEVAAADVAYLRGERAADRGDVDEAAGAFLEAAVRARRAFSARMLASRGADGAFDPILTSAETLHDHALARFVVLRQGLAADSGSGEENQPAEGPRGFARIVCGGLGEVCVFDGSCFEPSRDAILAAAPPGTPVEATVALWAATAGAPGQIPRRYYERFEDAFALRTLGLRSRHRRPGLGAELIAIRDNPLDRAGRLANHPPEGLHHPVTVTVAEPVPGCVVLHWWDPFAVERIPLAADLTGERGTVPLAADFTAPYARLLDRTKLPSLGFRGMLDADVLADREDVYLLQPFDRDRIPLLLVHGLQSSPVAWREITNEVFGDPVLRDRYQVLALRVSDRGARALARKRAPGEAP
jgi:hypothetical protein